MVFFYTRDYMMLMIYSHCASEKGAHNRDPDARA